MNATMRFIVWGTIPIGAIVGGFLGGMIGLHETIWVAAIGGVVRVPAGAALAGALDQHDARAGRGGPRPRKVLPPPATPSCRPKPPRAAWSAGRAPYVEVARGRASANDEEPPGGRLSRSDQVVGRYFVKLNSAWR